MNFRFKLISIFFYLVLILISSTSLKAADVLDDIEEDKTEAVTGSPGVNAPQLFNETIKTISPSKKIFIITNENQGFGKGDFISLLLANQLVCRALVAKTTGAKLSGIKILKIYSLPLWNQLNQGKEVLVLRGDDSYYNVVKTVPSKDDGKNKKKTDSKIETDEDLFNTTSNANEDDQSMEENSKRLIKPDNLLALNYGLIQGKNNSGETTRYPHLNGNWAYQLTDNVWGELGVGTNTIRDFPNVNGLGGLDTRMTSVTARFKYTITAPFYSYIMPYAGYQLVLADSPGAGVYDATQATSSETLALEKQLVEDLKHNGPIFGVTILKRVVPGWFGRVDLGSDIIGAGLSLEF
jgi:hypothetical protein